MAEESVFREVLTFFNKLGVYDVVLPFLLTFSILFAILEKTKVLGLEKAEGKGGGEMTTKKNLNAMVAFVGAFFVIASTKLVAIVHQTLANVVLLLLVVVSFLLLVGTIYPQKEEDYLTSGWKKFMIFILFIAVVLIFMYAIPMDDGTPFLEYAYDFVVDNFDTTAVSAVILTIRTYGMAHQG